MNLENWQNKVLENCHILETVAKDRAILKNLMENYLREFFDYEKIEWSKDFRKITLKWGFKVDPVIPIDKIGEFSMPIVITTGYNDELGQGVWIEVYPFGLEEGGIEEI